MRVLFINYKGVIMVRLAELTCEACDKSSIKLSSDEISILMPKIKDWELLVDSDVQKLKRIFKVKNYTEAIELTNKVAELSDSVNHHPQIILEYASVTVIWWSHNIKGLHNNDFIMADKTSQLFE